MEVMECQDHIVKSKKWLPHQRKRRRKRRRLKAINGLLTNVHFEVGRIRDRVFYLAFLARIQNNLVLTENHPNVRVF